MSTAPEEHQTPRHGPHQLSRLVTSAPISGADSRDLWGVPKIALAIGSLCILILATYFFYQQSLSPARYDAANYRELAGRFDSRGIDDASNQVRTFGYPWILSLLLRISRVINLPFSFLLLTFQVSCYIVAAATIARAVRGNSRKLSGWVYLLLSCNIFVAPYFSITLTDSLYTALALIVLGLAMQLENQAAIGVHGSFKRLLLMSVLAAFGVAVRPAAMWLIAVVLSCCALLLTRKKAELSNILFALTLGFLPLLVQIIINSQMFRVATPFPVMNLGTQQLKWGIENFKYATWMGGADISPRFFYLSGYSVPLSLNDSPVMWYVENPLSAIRLLSFKFISAFDFDFLLPYPDSLPERLWLASAFSLSFLYLGLCGTFLHLCSNSLTALGSRFSPLLIVLAWAAVTIPSAIELRFVLPMLAYFMVVSCVLLNFLITRRSIRLCVTVVTTGLVVFPCFFSVSSFVRAQSLRAQVEAYRPPSVRVP